MAVEQRWAYILTFVDAGNRISYQALEPGTPVYSSDEQQIGTVAQVLAVEDEDVFDGIVIGEHLGSGGHRFADADEIGEIYERGVFLKLDRAAAEQLPEPSANPAVMRVDPAQVGRRTLGDRLKAAWHSFTGKY